MGDMDSKKYDDYYEDLTLGNEEENLLVIYELKEEDAPKRKNKKDAYKNKKTDPIVDFFIIWTCLGIGGVAFLYGLLFLTIGILIFPFNLIFTFIGFSIGIPLLYYAIYRMRRRLR